MRIILIGLHSGTRPGAIMRLRWPPSPVGGWLDVERGLKRRRPGRLRRKKRQPPAPLHKKLRLHARHRQKSDQAKGIGSVIHYDGLPIKDGCGSSLDGLRIRVL